MSETQLNSVINRLLKQHPDTNDLVHRGLLLAQSVLNKRNTRSSIRKQLVRIIGCSQRTLTKYGNEIKKEGSVAHYIRQLLDAQSPAMLKTLVPSTYSETRKPTGWEAPPEQQKRIALVETLHQQMARSAEKVVSTFCARVATLRMLCGADKSQRVSLFCVAQGISRTGYGILRSKTGAEGLTWVLTQAFNDLLAQGDSSWVSAHKELLLRTIRQLHSLTSPGLADWPSSRLFSPDDLQCMEGIEKRLACNKTVTTPEEQLDAFISAHLKACPINDPVYRGLLVARWVLHNGYEAQDLRRVASCAQLGLSEVVLRDQWQPKVEEMGGVQQYVQTLLGADRGCLEDLVPKAPVAIQKTLDKSNWPSDRFTTQKSVDNLQSASTSIETQQNVLSALQKKIEALPPSLPEQWQLRQHLRPCLQALCQQNEPSVTNNTQQRKRAVHWDLTRAVLREMVPVSQWLRATKDPSLEGIAEIKCLLHILDDFCEELQRWPEDTQRPAPLQQVCERLKFLIETLDHIFYNRLSEFLPSIPDREEFLLTDDEYAKITEELELLYEDDSFLLSPEELGDPCGKPGPPAASVDWSHYEALYEQI